jgi:hypothetical protein
MLEFIPNFDPYERLLRNQRELADLQHNQVVLANQINDQLRMIQHQQGQIQRLEHFIQNVFEENK